MDECERPILTAAVMGDIRRQAMIDRLVVELDAESAGVPLDVVVDGERNGCWETARRAWELTNPAAAEWRLIIQDDAMPCPGFWGHVFAALAALPDQARIVSFFGIYSPSTPVGESVREVLASGGHWVRFDACDTGLCMAIRSADVADMLQFAAQHIHPRCVIDDYHYSMWCRARRHEGWFAVPSLVEHIGDQSLLFGEDFNLPIRRASYLVGQADIGTAIDWTAGIWSAPWWHLAHEARYAEFWI